MTKEALIEKVAREAGITDYEFAESVVHTTLAQLARILPSQVALSMGSRLPGPLQELFMTARGDPQRMDTRQFFSSLQEKLDLERDQVETIVGALFRVMANDKRFDAMKDIVEYLPDGLRQLAWTKENT